jgi:ribosomal protein L16 Arg81 hydroxylase
VQSEHDDGGVLQARSSEGQDGGAPQASVLEQLLAPFDPKVFVEEWWGRKALFVKGTPEKFAELFDRERFLAAAKYGAERPHIQTFRLSAVVQDFDGAWARTEPIEPEQIPSALEDGSTICVNDISIGDERLAAVCDDVAREMQFLGRIRFNSYLSNNDSGTDTHIDTSITTTLQIEGKKRWRYQAEPAVPWPPSNAQVQRDGTRVWSLPWVGHAPWEQLDPVDLDDFEEVVLEAGDFLCLPAGTWHNTRAVGSSLALNLAFAPRDCFSVLLEFLQPIFEESPDWRSGIPPTYSPGEPSGQVPEGVRDYLRTRFDEVATYLQSFTPDDRGTTEWWHKLTD